MINYDLSMRFLKLKISTAAVQRSLIHRYDPITSYDEAMSSAADDLKQLLHSTLSSKTPVKPKESSERDLASLLSSVDITTPARGKAAVTQVK
jgi:hypothetical protein